MQGGAGMQHHLPPGRLVVYRGGLVPGQVYDELVAINAVGITLLEKITLALAHEHAEKDL